MLKSPRPFAAVACCAVALFSQTTLASNSPTFGPPEAVSTTIPAVNTVMGDFDGDGIPDVAIMAGKTDMNGNFIGGSVEVHFGDGSNGFRTTTATIDLNLPGSYYEGIAAADVIGAGQSQLIIAGTNIVAIYNWSGGTGFIQTSLIDLTDTGITGTFVVVGDLTKPGSRDLLVTDRYVPYAGSVGMVWVTNDGTGNFGAPTLIPNWGGSTRPVLADVNGDGLVDIVVDDPVGVNGGIGTNFSEGGGTVGVLLNNGDGTFGQEVFWGIPSLYGMTNSTGQYESLNTVGVAVADVNGDGKADLISGVFVYDSAPDFTYTYYLSVNLGNGDGTFQDGIPFPVINGIVKLDTADIDGNGQLDVVTIDDKLLDQLNPGFTVTEISGVGNNIAVTHQDDFPADGPSYTSLALGYKSAYGTFINFNNDKESDVILGSGQNIYAADGSEYHQFVVFKNTTGTILPPTSLLIVAPSRPGGPIGFIASQPSTAPGLIVRIQYSTTPTVDGSWTDLPDGNGGHLTPGGMGLFSFGTSGTTFYPAGTAVYFRAITSAPGFTDSISGNAVTPYMLEQGKFTINVRETSTSDPTGKLHVVHIGDNLNFTFIWTNIGNATAHNVVVETHVPTYQDATNDLHYQFPSNDLTYAAWGTYIRETAPGAGDAKVRWNESDMPPGSSQAATLTVKINSSVRLQQEIAVLDDYEVQSSDNEPPTVATGTSSRSPNEYSTVLGTLSLTITPNVTKVAPGGLINYTIKVQNLASYTAKNVVIADPAPEFTHFAAATFVNPVASPAFKVMVGNKAVNVSNPLRLVGLYPSNSLPPAVQTFLADNPEIVAPSDYADQAVFYVGNLAKGASATVHFSVQAEFIDSLDVPDQEIKNVDYLAYFEDPSGNIVESKNESGVIIAPVAGTVKNAPDLTLQKSVSATDLGPGEYFLVTLLAENSGASAADDVFIEDNLPQGASTVNPELLTIALNPQVVTAGSSQAELNSSIDFTNTSPISMTKSKANYFVTLATNGFLTVQGMHMEPKSRMTIYYLMRVPGTTPVPESLVVGPCFIGAGNGNQTPLGANEFDETVAVGTQAQTAMQINGNVVLFTPDHPFEAVPSPTVSSDAATTAAQLDALYKKTPNASLIVPKSNPPAPVPGVQIYYIHYQNLGADIANDVHLLFPTPTNTVFYRASLVLHGSLLTLGPDQSISEPPKLGSGNVIFNLGTLSNSVGGYAMVEVIILPTAINTTSSRIAASTPLFYTGAQPMETPRKLDDNSTNGTIVYDGQNVPHVGVVKIVPQVIQQGAIFAIQCAMFNYGGVGGNEVGDVTFQAPAGTEIVGLTGTALVISSNATSMELSLAAPEHFASGFNVLLHANAVQGPTFTENSIVVNVVYCGTFTPAPTSIQVVGSQQAVPSTTITKVLGAQFATLGEMAVIPLGPYQPGVGSALVCGPTGRFGDLQSDSVISDSWGTTLVVGLAQDIPLLNLPVLKNTDTKTALEKLTSIIGKAGGDVFNGPGFNLVAADGEEFIDNNTGLVGTGLLHATVKGLLAAGAQSVLASGTGSLPAVGHAGPAVAGGGVATGSGGGHVFTSGGGVVSNDGGSVVSNDGGSLVGPSGGTLVTDNGGAIIAHDSSGLISQDGGGLISQDGGGLISSPASTAAGISPDGNISGY